MPGKTASFEPLNDALVQSFASSTRAAGLAEGTVKEYVRHLRMFARAINRSLIDVDRGAIEQYVNDEMLRTSAASAAYAVRALKRFFAWLVTEDEVEVSPAAKVRTPKVPEPNTKVATEADIEALLQTTKPGKLFVDYIDYRDRALIEVLRSTGARIAEVARIRLEDVSLEDGLIVVPRSKSGHPRVIVLDSKAVRALGGYLRRIDETVPGCLWRTQGGSALTLDGVKSAFDRRAAAAGLTTTPHQLRRASAVGLLRDGVSGASVQRLFGWRSPLMISRYTSALGTELAIAEFRRVRS